MGKQISFEEGGVGLTTPSKSRINGYLGNVEYDSILVLVPFTASSSRDWWSSETWKAAWRSSTGCSPVTGNFGNGDASRIKP